MGFGTPRPMSLIRWNPGTGDPRIVVGSMVDIPKRLVDLDRVRVELTVKNEIYWQTLAMGASTKGMEPTYELWTETDASISVPRHFFAEMINQPDMWAVATDKLAEALLRMVDHRKRSLVNKTISHSITLRDRTQQEASLSLISTTNDKIISLACGKGKTVVSLHAASVGHRFPLLIVVHTNALMDQWRENRDENDNLIGGIKKFYGLEDDEIGHIQAHKADWRGKRVAIAMLHSLVLKEYEHDFYHYWRLIIFDEVHRLGAHFFQAAAAMFPAERWGLSATVDREDKMDRIFRLHLGSVVYKDLEQPLAPDVFFVSTGISVDMSRFMMRSGRVNMGSLLTKLSEDEKRNALILSWIRRAYKQGRKILILGERLAQLYNIAETLQAEGIDAAVHVGSMKQEERREALRHRVVCATQHLAKEGLDCPSLDTLFILFPFGGQGRLQQSLGRILREHATKSAPVAVIFEDNIGIISALSRRMRRAVKALGFQVNEVAVERKAA